ncbi:MAG: hypothetical protein WD030_09340 [Pirellulales bacterium]
MMHRIRCKLLCLSLGLLPPMLGCSGPTEPVQLSRGEQDADADESPAAAPSTGAVADGPDSKVDGEAIATNEANQTPPDESPKQTSSAVEVSGQPQPVSPPPAAGDSSRSDAISSTATRATSSAVNRKPLELSFDDIKFDIEPGDPFAPEMVPEKIQQYYGKRIRIRGYILPSFKQSGLTQFVLVRDNMECCFGPGAALYDCIRVEMEPGKATEFSIRPVAVEGIFELEEFYGPDDKHLAIYYMTGEEVK